MKKEGTSTTKESPSLVGAMNEKVDLDHETFGAAADEAPGDLPDFFGNNSSGDQEFSSLMRDLKDAAMAETGADSGAGGLEGLYDGTDTNALPDYFSVGRRRGGGTSTSARGRDANTAGGLNDDAPSTSLFDRLSAFGGAGESDANDLLASLGLPLRSNQSHGSAGGLSVDGVALGLSGGDNDDGSGGANTSEWARMQKQFEDMNKSFLQDYKYNEVGIDEGPLDTDDGNQVAFATMRQLSLDDLDSGFPLEDSAPSPPAATATHTGPSLLPPGAKTLEELEAEFAPVSISTSSPMLGSLIAPPRAPSRSQGSESGSPSMLSQGDRFAGPVRRSSSGDRHPGGGVGGMGVAAEQGMRLPSPQLQSQGLRTAEQDPRQGQQGGIVNQGRLWPEQQHQQAGFGPQQGARQLHSPVMGPGQPSGAIGAPHGSHIRGPQGVASSVGPGGQQQGGLHAYGSSHPSRSRSPRIGPQPFPHGGPGQGQGMGQGRPPQPPPPQQQQQVQQQHQQQQQQHPGFAPPRPGAGMPPFHTLPPHVQAHLLQQQAIAHGRGPPRSGQPPQQPPNFAGGMAFPPGMPPPSQQQHAQQHQHQHQGLPVQGGQMGPRGHTPGMSSIPVHGQRFSARGDLRGPLNPGTGGGGPAGMPPPQPPQQYARAPMPRPQPVVVAQHAPPPSQGSRDGRPPLPPIEMFPRGELMTAYDTRYVIMAQMRALETPDPFNDDFYYHNAMRRKQEKQQREMMRGAEPLVREATPQMPMPLPVWQETKEIAKKAKDEQADAVKKRIRQWESENRVLGHHARSDVHRPRALLVLSGAQGAGEEGESSAADGDVMVSGGAPFETHLWRARLAIQRATKAMLAAYELNYLLHLPSTPPAKKAEVAGRLGEVIVDLAVSLGLQRSTILQQADRKVAPDASVLEASLDLRVLSTVLELTKGQKLLSRCLAMLPPGQRSALVPSVLALTLARAPAASLRNAPSEQVKMDAIKAEEALANELKAVVQSPGALPLPILRRCIELVMTAHRGRGSLAAALGSVSRAEVLSAVLRRGGEMSEAEGGDAAMDWATLQAEFIAMAKESPQNSAVAAH